MAVNYEFTSELLMPRRRTSMVFRRYNQRSDFSLVISRRVTLRMDILPQTLKDQLVTTAEEVDRSAAWPEPSLKSLRDLGFLGRSVPASYGGSGLGPIELLRGLEEIATCCLTTAFILSQREAAIRNLLKAPEHLKERYLPRLATGEEFLTVGLSQLTTSRQHLGPALRATQRPSGGYLLNGEIPWVTGADQATAIVVGATLSDSTQILAVLPAELLEGVIDPPLPLASLTGSRTSLIRCKNVNLDPEWIISGPSENVLGKLGGGGLDTSCLAIGLSEAATRFIQQEANVRPDLVAIAERFDCEVQSNRERLQALAESVSEPNQTLALRTDCTKLALRTTQASLMVAKGQGFVAPHPVQRWTRQAMFFLVWSCPRPVAEGVLADLAMG